MPVNWQGEKTEKNLINSETMVRQGETRGRSFCLIRGERYELSNSCCHQGVWLFGKIYSQKIIGRRQGSDNANGEVGGRSLCLTDDAVV